MIQNNNLNSLNLSGDPLLNVHHKRRRPKTRYNDAEPAEFKELINEKISIAREELYELTCTLGAANTNSDDAAIVGKNLKDGSATFEKEPTNWKPVKRNSSNSWKPH